MDIVGEALLDLLSRTGWWPDSSEVGKRLDSLALEPDAVVDRARREERLIAVWHGERFHYPAFQFEPNGGPRAEAVSLIQVLPRDRNGQVSLDAVLWAFLHRVPRWVIGRRPRCLLSIQWELLRSRASAYTEVTIAIRASLAGGNWALATRSGRLRSRCSPGYPSRTRGTAADHDSRVRTSRSTSIGLLFAFSGVIRREFPSFRRSYPVAGNNCRHAVHRFDDANTVSTCAA